MKKCNTEDKIVPLHKYKKLKEICDSMSASVVFLKEHQSKNFIEIVDLTKKAILSLQFHKNLNFLKYLVEIFATKMPTDISDPAKRDITGKNIIFYFLFYFSFEIISDIILSLLSHYLMEVKQEMYFLCQQKVIAAIGPKLNVRKEGAPGTQILFLLQGDILIEIALNGLQSENYKVIIGYANSISFICWSFRFKQALKRFWFTL